MTTQSNNVRSAPLPSQAEPAPLPRPRRAPALGVLPASGIERAFIAMLYLICLVLVILSVIGTFYGIRGESASFQPFYRPLLDAAAHADALLAALIIQVVLSLTQYGARVMARTRTPRWWLLYIAALGVSVYYNVQAYYDPLVGFQIPPALALGLIAAGDIVPEAVAVRH